MTHNIDFNKLSPTTREILNNFLIPLNPDTSVPCLLNSLNAKLNQVIGFKRPKFKKTKKDTANIINYFGLNIVSSGGGKDKVMREIDRYILPKFKEYFDQENKNFIRNQIMKIEDEAKKLYTGSDSKQKTYIEAEKKKIRNLRFELSDATPEGLFADCHTVQNSGVGCIFTKISELGLFLENPTPAQQLFLNSIISLYDGDASLKSTKNESMSTDVKDIPLVFLGYSDTNKLLSDKANKYLMKLFDAGLIRRSFVTYMPDKEISINEDYLAQREIEDTAYESATKFSIDIYEKVIKLKAESIFQLTDEAFEIYHKYKTGNDKLYNQMLNKADDILLKELKGRHWKTLKLAGLISAIEHPEQLEITKTDMEYAIYQSELFAKDFSKFFKIKPETGTEKLFKFLLNKKGEWITKMDIRKQKFVNGTAFAKWFDEQIEYISDIAEEQGYTFKQETFNNGLGYKCQITENNLNKELDPKVISLDKLIAC